MLLSAPVLSRAFLLQATALTLAEVPETWEERKCQGRQEKESGGKKQSGVEAILKKS